MGFRRSQPSAHRHLRRHISEPVGEDRKKEGLVSISRETEEAETSDVG